MPHRPVLSPGLARLWRQDGSLQLGRTPAVARVLPDAGTHREALALLDGSRTLEQVLHLCPDAAPLLAGLTDAGLLVDVDDLVPVGLPPDDRERLAPDLSSLALVHGAGAARALQARRRARVVIHGAGRVGAPLAGLLDTAGIGRVEVRDDRPTRATDLGLGGLTAADTGRPRGTAVGERLRTSATTPELALVVLADDTVSDGSGLADLLCRTGVPHLTARVEERTGTVGPLVRPGWSSCLACLDLTRRSLDPTWPSVVAQVPRRGPSTAACDGVLAMAVAAQAALQVLQLLEGSDPASVGATLELTVPGWAWRRRTWPRHPGCSCSWEDRGHPIVA